jgi:poly(A) polymerase
MQALEILRQITAGTPYEGKLFLVGGIVRDQLLFGSHGEDIDIVLEGEAAELAGFLHTTGITDHAPVTYPQYGTAMVSVAGTKVEIVGARSESYERGSRKPATCRGTLEEDIYRRDFTINTLTRNLHTGEIGDITGRGLADLKAGIIRTPLDPVATFDDDPLRMMRAVKFACRLNFQIEANTLAGLKTRAARLAIISAERIRDEFTKVIMDPNVRRGMELLRETGLLEQFAPELAQTYGVTQNDYHIHDVWYHSLGVIDTIPPERGVALRLAGLLHDIGKPATRSVDAQGRVHFYEHQKVGAQMASELMRKLRFSNSETAEVEFLILHHLRVGEYDEEWTDTAVRRLLRECGDRLEDLITLTEADKSASNLDMPSVDIAALRARIERVQADLAGGIRSPLDGRAIMEITGIKQGAMIGAAKAFLENKVVEGVLRPDDEEKAVEMVKSEFGQNGQTPPLPSRARGGSDTGKPSPRRGGLGEVDEREE